MAGKKFSRGIEKVIALAALDAEFSRKLLTDREAAIDSCEIKLTQSERQILLSILNPQLDSAINRVKVPSEARRMFLKGAITAAVALILGTCVLFGSFSSRVGTAGLRAANPAAAIANLRTAYSAQELYKDRHNCYAKTLEELADAEFIDRSLSGMRNGYYFELSNVTIDGFELRAIPAKQNIRFFFLDQTGEVRYSDGPEVGPESQPLR